MKQKLAKCLCGAIQSIYKYSPKSNATADYKALVNEILGEE